jgi:hypothetical protein
MQRYCSLEPLVLELSVLELWVLELSVLELSRKKDEVQRVLEVPSALALETPK